MICESEISMKRGLLSEENFQEIKDFIAKFFETIYISSHDVDDIMGFIIHDKKNEAGQILFTLLSGVGNAIINQHVSPEEIRTVIENNLVL